MQDEKRNPFEALCDSRYCWRLGCTTCGCWPLRHDLYRLILGFYPDGSDWKREFRFVEQKTGVAPYREIVVRPVVGKFPSRFPEVARELSMEDQFRLQVIVKDVKLINLDMNEPRWLGYMGVVLHWCEEAESSNRLLTRALVPQFAELLATGQNHALHSFQHILDNGLAWQSLEVVEIALLGGNVIKQRAPW